MEVWEEEEEGGGKDVVLSGSFEKRSGGGEGLEGGMWSGRDMELGEERRKRERKGKDRKREKRRGEETRNRERIEGNPPFHSIALPLLTKWVRGAMQRTSLM